MRGHCWHSCSEKKPAATEVKKLIQTMQGDETVDVFVSIINLGEVYYRIGRGRGVELAADKETLLAKNEEKSAPRNPRGAFCCC